MLINNADEWITLFQHAINSSNTEQIHSLLQTLPNLKTEEEMQNVLLLCMDAESMICSLRQELVTKRADIISHFLSP